MSRMFLFASLAVALAVGFMLVGCTDQQSDQAPSAATTDHEDHEGHDHQNGEHAAHGQYEEALAQLSPADRALAEQQEVCPVSGDPLGAMGTPYKVTVQGRDVLLCCEGCEAAIKEDPDKYLAKLPPQ